MTLYAEKICEFHNNEEAKKAFLDEGGSGDMVISSKVKKWHRQLEEDFPKIQDAYSGNNSISSLLETFRGTFLYPGSL